MNDKFAGRCGFPSALRHAVTRAATPPRDEERRLEWFCVSWIHLDPLQAGGRCGVQARRAFRYHIVRAHM
jgi:hypothetical protein